MQNVFSLSSGPGASPSAIKNYFCSSLDQVIDCVTQPSTSTGHCQHMWSYGVCLPSVAFGQTSSTPCSNMLSNNEEEINGTSNQPMVSRYCNGTTGDWNYGDVGECSKNLFETSDYDYGDLGNFSLNLNRSDSDYYPTYDQNAANHLTSETSDDAEKKWAWSFNLLSKLVAAGYGLSLIALVNAVILLLLLRRLHCTRIYIHIHLMASFILRGALWTLHSVGIQQDDNTDEQDSAASIALAQTIFARQRFNDTENLLHIRQSYCVTVATDYTGCRLYQVALNYCVTANYYWLLVEGLYLKMLLRAFVFSHAKYMKMFLVLGWGMPWLSVLPWLLVELLDEDSLNLCWIAHENLHYWWIIKGPILLSLVINFYIFITVLRVVWLKLRATTVNQNDDYKWRLTKSTLALIPLLGIQYIVPAIWREYQTKANSDDNGSSKPSQDIYFDLFLQKAFEVIFGSLQGLFVVIIYCFFNSEVREECTKKWQAWKAGAEIDREHRRRSTLHTQLSCNLISKDDKNDVGNGHVTPEKRSLSNSPRSGNRSNRETENQRCFSLVDAAEKGDGSTSSYDDCNSSAATHSGDNKSEAKSIKSNKSLAQIFYDSLSQILKKTKGDNKLQSSSDDELSQSVKLLSSDCPCNNNPSKNKQNNSPDHNKVIVHPASDSPSHVNKQDVVLERELCKAICQEPNVYLTVDDVSDMQETNI